MKPDRIVAGIDFSEPSLAAARWVTRHFAPRAEVILTHVIDIPAPPVFLESRYPLRSRLVEATREGAERRLEDMRAAIAEGREAAVEVQIRVGRSYSELIAAAREAGAGMVAVGQNGTRPGVRRMLGSTAERLLHESHVPVLVVRGAMGAPPARILVPVDGSASSMRALTHARTLQVAFGASLTILHAIHPSIFAHLRLVASPEAARHVEKEVESTAREWIAEHLREADGVEDRTTVEIVFGEPRHEILAAARRLDSDLIVMGARGAGEVRRPLLGCVAVAVLHGTSCPVLAVTNTESSEGAARS